MVEAFTRERLTFGGWRLARFADGSMKWHTIVEPVPVRASARETAGRWHKAALLRFRKKPFLPWVEDCRPYGPDKLQMRRELRKRLALLPPVPPAPPQPPQQRPLTAAGWEC